MSKPKMKRIVNIVSWFIEKTIDRVDARADNGTAFYFKDGTAIWVESELIDSVTGLYGPAYYEIDPNRPVHEQ